MTIGIPEFAGRGSTQSTTASNQTPRLESQSGSSASTDTPTGELTSAEPTLLPGSTSVTSQEGAGPTDVTVSPPDQMTGLDGLSAAIPSPFSPEAEAAARQLWTGTFDLNGYALTARDNQPAQRLDFPSTIQSTWLNQLPRARFFTRRESGSGLGLDFGVVDPEGANAYGVWVITPLPNGTITYGIVLDKPVQWLSLAENTSSRGTAFNGLYDVSIQRSSRGSWTLDVTRDPERPQDTSDTSIGQAHVEIVADAPHAPWKKVAFDFHVSLVGESPADIVGHAELERTS